MPDQSEISEEEVKNVLSLKGQDWLSDRIKAKSKEIRVEEGKRLEEGLHAQNLHDELIQSCISAFNPESECCRDSGYKFTTVEPLNELKVKNFDVLLFNEVQELGIFVECKTDCSDWSKEVTHAYQAIEDLERNIAYLEGELKLNIRQKEYVMCVPSEHENSVANAIEAQEKMGRVDAKVDPLLLIWGIHLFSSNQKIQLFTRIHSKRDDFKKHHRDKKLTSLLTTGVSTSSEVLAAFFPSSHPIKVFPGAVPWILRENQRAGRDLTVFPKSLPVSYFTDSRNLPHYSRMSIGADFAERFIREGTELQLMEEVPGDKTKLKFTSKGKTRKTIHTNYKKAYMDWYLEKNIARRAERMAVVEYLKIQATLVRYE
ncbi:MAG TPA: hypothetical protein VGB78_09770 [Thermoplasmata archaeon]